MITSAGNTLRSIQALLSESVDYAGLFPPSQLPMEEAVANYASYLEGPDSWMLGRFVCPASRLDEFLNVAEGLAPSPSSPWRIAVIADGDTGDSFAKIGDFNAKHSGSYVCDVVEIKVQSEFNVASIVKTLPVGVTAYFEVAADENTGQIVATLASLKQRAKMRTGGVTEDAFPSIKEVLRFVRICAVVGVPFKVTAGLHHPIRCIRPLTYEPDAPCGTMHGFLNLFLASAFASRGGDIATLEEIMRAESVADFEFTDTGISWKGKHFLRTAQISLIREKTVNSFGSCSFTEPTDELRELGLL